MTSTEQNSSIKPTYCTCSRHPQVHLISSYHNKTTYQVSFQYTYLSLTQETELSSPTTPPTYTRKELYDLHKEIPLMYIRIPRSWMVLRPTVYYIPKHIHYRLIARWFISCPNFNVNVGHPLAGYQLNCNYRRD